MSLQVRLSLLVLLGLAAPGPSIALDYHDHGALGDVVQMSYVRTFACYELASVDEMKAIYERGARENDDFMINRTLNQIGCFKVLPTMKMTVVETIGDDYGYVRLLYRPRGLDPLRVWSPRYDWIKSSCTDADYSC
jgi:hypothetical protein